VIYLQAAFDIL